VNQLLTKSVRTSFVPLSLLACIFFLAFPGMTFAQDDPPSRVARLNFIQGSVSFQPAGTQDWFDANPNRPLTIGDQLWADQGARGELHLGSTAIRVSELTGVSFLNLTDQAVQIQVAQGSADFRIVHMYDGENYEIDTANQAFTILRPGEYRVDVSPDGSQTVLTVRSGAGEVTAGGQAYDVGGGQQYTFQGIDEVDYNADSLPDADSFDSWCFDRDHREDRAMSARYVSREVIGYDDLDANGTWHIDPTYGPVWVPTGIAVGWAPYHTGQWAFVAPWGWTWVDEASWGFAPFHYGRWAYMGGAWGWIPGPVAVVGPGGPRVGVVVGGGWGVRPVYAPALVGFIGGGGFSASITIGGGVAGVAWVALGPSDVWVPGYHVSAAYMTNVNVANSTVVNRTQVTNIYTTTVINNNTTVNVNKVVYANQAAPGAVTAVPQEAFQGGKPVATASVKMTPEQISSPKVISAKPVAPTPQSVAGVAHPAAASARPPAAIASHPVVTKMAPSARAIPVGHSAPLTATAYKPATKPNARPNTIKPGSQPVNAAGKPANTPSNRPGNATAPNPSNAPGNKPPNAMEARPANPPSNKPANEEAQQPRKFTPPPSHTTTSPEEKPSKPAVEEKPAEPPKKTAPPTTEAPKPETHTNPNNEKKEDKKEDKKPPKDTKDKDQESH
jgi:hypothetical protein